MFINEILASFQFRLKRWRHRRICANKIDGKNNGTSMMTAVHAEIVLFGITPRLHHALNYGICYSDLLKNLKNRKNRTIFIVQKSGEKKKKTMINKKDRGVRL